MTGTAPTAPPSNAPPPAATASPHAAGMVLMVVLGLPWVAVLAVLPSPAGAVWALSALALWLRTFLALGRGDPPPNAVLRWWAASLVAPAVLAVVLIDAVTAGRRRGPVAPSSPPRHTEAPSMPDPILSRLDDAERKVRALEAELRSLRTLVTTGAPGAAPPAPTATPVSTATPARVEAPPVIGEPAAAPSQPAPERVVVHRHVPPRERRTVPAMTLSDLLGARALAWAGGVVTLLGVVFLFVLAVNRGWIGPGERVLLGALASACLVGAGVLARRRYGQLDAAVAAVGAGLAGWYTTLLAATVLYGLVGHAVALLLAAAIAGVGTGVALAWSAEILAGIGLVGAALAPAAVALDSGIEVTGTAFAAIVFAAIAVVSHRRAWTWLLVAGVAATAPQWLALVVAERDQATTGGVAVAAALVALYLGTAVARGLGEKRPGAITSTLVSLSVGLGVLSAEVLLDEPGVGLLLLAAPYAVLTAVLFARARDLSAVLAAAAMLASALGLAELLGGATLALAWAVQAAAFAWLAGRTVEPRFATAALAYLGLAVGHALVYEAPPADLYRAGGDPAAGIPTVLVVGAAAALVAWFARTWAVSEGEGGRLAAVFARVVGAKDGVALGSAALAALAAVDAASLATLALVDAAGAEPSFDWGRVAVAALWSAVGAVAYVAGSWSRRRVAVTAGAVWLGVTAVDVLAFDLGQLAQRQAGWAAAAIAVGLVVAGYGAEVVRRLPRVAPGSLSIAAVVGSAGFAAVAVARLLETDRARGLAFVALAGVAALLSAAVFGRDGRRDVATSLWSLAGAGALVGAQLLLDGTAFVAASSALVAAFALLFRATGERRFAAAAIVPLAVAVGSTVVEVAPLSDLFVENDTPGHGTLAVAIVAGALAALAAVARVPDRRSEDAVDEGVDAALPVARPAFAWAAAAGALYAGSLGILGLVLAVGSADLTTEFQRGHTTVSAFWGVVALATLYVGLRRGTQALRLAGFALFGAGLVKLFIYDLSTLSSVTRALSFLAVGAVLLLAGFFYQRLAGPRGGGPRAA